MEDEDRSERQYEGTDIEDYDSSEPEIESETLETLLEVGEQAIEKEIGGRPTDLLTMDEYVSDRLDGVEYGAEEIQNFVLAGANRDYDEMQSRRWGLYSGSLVNELAERNREKDEDTVVMVDGEGQRFPYLFSGVSSADRLLIQNVVGPHIGHKIGSKTGNIAQISDKASVKQVILDRITGYRPGSCIGAYRRGSVGQVILNRITGDRAGAYMGAYDGDVGQGILNQIDGEEQGYNIGPPKQVSQVLRMDQLSEDNEVAQEIVREHQIERILELTHSLEGKNREEQRETLDQIYEIYRQNRHKIEEPESPETGSFTETPTGVHVPYQLPL